MVYAVEQNKVLVPGNSNRYLAWGYADQSFRLGNYESDKAVFVCEPNYLVGQVNVKTRDGTIYLWSLHARDQFLA
jgi:hypothetical protein